MTDQVLIYSNHHKAWWGPDGNNYYRSIDNAGRYEPADTVQWLGRGCGCCPVPEVVVDVPAPAVLGDPAALAVYAGEAPQAATRAAIDAGQINPWAKHCERCQTAYSRGECCSSHGKGLCHGCYRRTHFVEICVAGCADCATEGLDRVAVA